MEIPDKVDLEKLNLGRDEAEVDEHLAEFFLETPSFRGIKRGEKMYVLGRKGTGKSAIYKFLKEIKDPELIVEGLTFNDYPWQIHNQIKDESHSVDFAHVNTWTYLILLVLSRMVIKEGYHGELSEALQPLRRFLEHNYGSVNPNMDELFADKSRKLKKLELPKITGWGGGGFEMHEPANLAKIINSVNVITPILIKNIPQLLSHRKYFILFDRLDDGFDNSPLFRSSIIGLLRASRDLNYLFRSQGKQLHCVVFLRSDIYETLQYNDKNKAFEDIENLKWDRSSLLNIVERRIKVSYGIPDIPSKAWNLVFEEEQMRSKVYKEDYIIRRTLNRPRDIISFCRECRDEAVDHQHLKVSNDDIYQAEFVYSTRVYQEFIDENNLRYPYLDSLFDVLKNVHIDRFTFDQFSKEFQKSPSAEKMKPEDAIRTLFELDIIGFPKAGGIGGGGQVAFSYLDPYMKMDLSKTIFVHSSLKKHLQLVERRSS